MELSAMTKIKNLCSKDRETKSKQTSEQERNTWSREVEFLMSCIATCVGLGNVWRFPFTAYENGGGAFLLPYIVCLLIIGKPLYYLEVILGQFASKESVHVFETLAPVLKGIGVGQVLGNAIVGTYYCSLVAVTLFYLYHSFTSNLPWSNCKPEWNNELVQCVPSIRTTKLTSNYSISSSELWYRNEVMKQTTNIDNGIGLPDAKLTLFLFLSWSAIFLITMKGIKSSGKAAYFLAIFPYVIMFALLIRAVTLDGSTNGIIYFLNPQWDKITDAKVWYHAVTQCMFSLAIGTGILMMYSSYNHFSHNAYRAVLILTTMDTLTSVVAGITIFAVLGNLAHNLEVPIDEVINGGGTALAFVSYPDAIAKFDAVPWLFAALFFTMLFVLGLGSMAGVHGVACTFLKDSYPFLNSWHISFIMALISFTISVVYVTPGGEFVLKTVDFYLASFLPITLMILETFAIFWWYGVENFCLDVEFMTKRKVGFYWKICWSFLTPVSLLMIFLYSLCTLEPLKNGDHSIPGYIIGVGWALLGLGIFQPLIWWVIFVYRRRKLGFRLAVAESICLNAWGPRSIEVWAEWTTFKEEKMNQNSSQNWFNRKLTFFLK